MIAINICQQVRQKTEAMKNFSQSVDFHFDVRSATKFTLYPKLWNNNTNTYNLSLHSEKETSVHLIASKFKSRFSNMHWN